MWPSSDQGYLSLIDAKRAERTRLLSDASTITVSDEQSNAFLVATGTSYIASSGPMKPLRNLTGDLGLTAAQIVSKIKAGEWTASEVVDAYIKRAVLAQELTNCITEGMHVSTQSRFCGPATSGFIVFPS